MTRQIDPVGALRVVRRKHHNVIICVLDVSKFSTKIYSVRVHHSYAKCSFKHVNLLPTHFYVIPTNCMETIGGPGKIDDIDKLKFD